MKEGLAMSSTTSETASSPTLSEKRLAANRANAQHSTGPRTPQGKARSSQNAATHRLFCQSPVQPGESAADYATYHAALLTDLAPQTSFELTLADRAITTLWRLRRLHAADHHLITLEQAAPH